MSNSIFISYSHIDKTWLENLQEFLNPVLSNDESLKDKKVILWSDEKINPGEKWREEIEKALDTAKLAILLVSQNFLKSKFIIEIELPLILEAVDTKGLTVSWIHLTDSTYYNSSSIGEYQALSNPARPLAALPKQRRNKEWVKICDRIVKQFKGEEIDPFEAVPQSKKKIIAESGSSAKEGMKALVQLMETPNVRESFVQFEDRFRTSCKEIEIMSFYKTLHDLLHTLQIQYYKLLMNIIREIRINPANLSVWNDTARYKADLKNIVDGLNETTKQTNLIGKVPWVATLIADLQTLSNSISNHSVETITTTLRQVQRVLLLESVKLNDRLIQASCNLELPTLIDALNSAQNDFGPNLNPAILNKFRKGIEALINLNDNLILLRDEHDRWQNIDVELRKIEGTMSRDTTELKDCWADLKPMTEKICRESNEDWALSIMEATEKLDNSLATDDQKAIQDDFLSYRSLLSGRFYKVDLTLKELCERLREVGEPLAVVWEMINEHH